MKTIPKQSIIALLTEEALEWREDVRTAEANPCVAKFSVSPFVAHFCERLTTLINKEPDDDDALEYKRVERLAFDLHQEMQKQWPNAPAIAADMVIALMDSILKLYK